MIEFYYALKDEWAIKSILSYDWELAQLITARATLVNAFYLKRMYEPDILIDINETIGELIGHERIAVDVDIDTFAQCFRFTIRLKDRP